MTRGAVIIMLTGAAASLASCSLLLPFGDYSRGSGGAASTGGAAVTSTGVGGAGGAGGAPMCAGPCAPGFECTEKGCAGVPESPMPNPASAGLPHSASYAASAPAGVVIDNVTRLWWQHPVDTNDSEGHNCKVTPGGADAGGGGCTLNEAVSYCAHLTLGGHHDWRLPTRIELVSLLDWTLLSQLALVDSTAFANTPRDYFWSSSLLQAIAGFGWGLDFAGGYTLTKNLAGTANARCVRDPTSVPCTPGDGGMGGPCAPPVKGSRFQVTNGGTPTGTVLDTKTTLTWQQAVPAQMTWANGNTYCQKNSDGLPGTGWRLPSIKELQTIIDETGDPALDATIFQGMPGKYWSSSPQPHNTTAWYLVTFGDGSVYTEDGTLTMYVRCVH
jgi:hypothetical protein